jgi:hypothetical protein
MMRKSLLTVAIASLFMVPGPKTQDKSPRAYFDELKSSGAFMHTLTTDKGEKLSSPDPGYVCFAENNPAADIGAFLVFDAMAYDKHYAEAEAVSTSNASSEEKQKALARMEDIQHRQPYVFFLPDEIMSAMSADADFFRRGGEELDLSFYLDGVKNWTVSFHRLAESDEWKTVNSKMDFAVEPSTMRFLWSVHGDKPLVLNGRCEKINKDKA